MTHINRFYFRFVLLWIAFFSFLKDNDATSSFLSSNSPLEEEQAQEVYLACEYNDVEKLKSLMYKQVPIDYTKNSLTGFQWACSIGCIEVVQLFFDVLHDKKAFKEQLPKALYKACYKDRLAVVKLLLKKKVPIDYKHNGWANWTAFQQVCFYGNKETIELFLDAQYCWEELKKQFPRALYEACYGNNPSIAHLLLKRKVNIDYTNKKNHCTGFQYACSAGYIDIVQLLLDTAYCQKALKKQLAIGLYHACDENNPDVVKLLLKKKAPISYTDKEGKTGFLLSCGYGQPKIIRFFFQHVQEIKESLIEEHLWVVKNITKESKIVLPIDIERLIASFIVQGIDPEKKDKEGNTGLHLAVLAGNLQVVQLLLGHGFDPMLLNNEGKTPLMLAEKYPHIKHQMLHVSLNKKA